jgi:hypothetical protein
MSNKIRSVLKSGLALTLAAGVLSSAMVPAQAGDGGAIAAGILGGTALGVIVGSSIARPAPPPPPPPGYYEPGAYAPPPPPRCWYEPQQVWDGYQYVVRRVRVCQ